jgi:hypothetical protein
LPFASVLAATDGFWVNVGAATAPTVPPLTGAEGLYSGTLTGMLSNAFEMIVLENGDFWSLYGTQSATSFSVNGLAQGTGFSSGANFTANMKDFGFQPSVSGTVSASYNATTKTISGTMSEPKGTVTFSGGPVVGSLYDYSAAASLATISGYWLTSNLSGESIALNITANGAFTGNSITSGCQFSGTITPRPSGKNVFNVAATFGPAPCGLPNVVATGIAVAMPQANGKTQLSIAAVEGTRSYGTVVFGTR